MDIGVLKQQVTDIATEIVELRRELHKVPEPGNEEFRTAKIIETELKLMGLNIKKPLTTGMFATIEGEKKGEEGIIGDNEKTKASEGIALRADIDGLPIKEMLRLPYASVMDGYMHACGHDVHTAILIGTAKILTKNRQHLNKNIRLIFQPAEETTGGAERLIAAGCLRDPEFSSVYGLHIMPELLAGQVGIKHGCVHAGSDMFQIDIKGKASHGASPEMGIDALLAACQVVNNLQTVVSRSINPVNSAVLTVGKLRSGSARNIIAEEATLEGIIRSIDPEVGSLIRERTEEIVQFSAAALGALGSIKFMKGYPSLINDANATDRLQTICEDLIGKGNCIEIENPSMRVEDFSYFLQKAKGSFFFLGSGFPHRENPPIHTGNLYINEKCIETGILIMSGLCLI